MITMKPVYRKVVLMDETTTVALQALLSRYPRQSGNALISAAIRYLEKRAHYYGLDANLELLQDPQRYLQDKAG